MADFSQQQHDMCLEKTHPTGAEEWHCPTCGRRFVLQWPPKYKRIVLNGGDEYAAHSAGKGGLQMGNVQVTDIGDAPEDLHLEHWEDWFVDIDFEGQ